MMNEEKVDQTGKNFTNVGVVQRDINIYINNTQSRQDEPAEQSANAVDREDNKNHEAVFNAYIQKAIKYCSTKKTLLYEHQPHSFYELYVCNDLSYYTSQFSSLSVRSDIHGFQNNKQNAIDKIAVKKRTIKDATPECLEQESKYIIIAGTGGIGKSMFLTHILLSSAKKYSETKKLPVLATIKDYTNNIHDIVDFLLKFVRAFDPKISRQNIIQKLENGRVLLMLDGLDELTSALREKFNSDIENFIKMYPENTVIMTSRRTDEFVSYTRFSVFDIELLTKKQAIQLIKKLSYWDEQAKSDFLKALEKDLYRTHRQFASNPLLLTIMLMTYTTFGEVPAKMHVFYAKAYETMARLHDATKGSFQRPFHTKLTPEEFAKLFAEFCARTYKEEKVEFTREEFAFYMDKVLNGKSKTAEVAKACGVTSADCLKDLTHNLCIMYHEGEKYYFIHRSFQEYFAALYFAFDYDSNLRKVGAFFENTEASTSADNTFDMLYDMIPEKIERYIFLPYLEKLMNDILKNNASLLEKGAYWDFLEKLYPVLFYKYGAQQDNTVNTDDDGYNGYSRRYGNTHLNRATSFLYRTIIREGKLKSKRSIDNLPWPIQIYENLDEDWFKEFRTLKETVKTNRKSKELIDNAVALNLQLRYASPTNYASPTSIKNYSFAININEVRTNLLKFVEIHQFMERKDFPLMEEYQNVVMYYNELKSQTNKEDKSEELFDD